MAGKNVLLARPHGFIVSEMLPFLTGAGYAPQRLGSLAELETLSAGSYSGVIISNAVISSINATAEEVFTAIRKKMPRVPVIFAGLTEFALAKGAVARAVKSLHANAEVYPIDNATLAQAGLGAENTFVVLTKDDFASAAALSIAEKILQKHFR